VILSSLFFSELISYFVECSVHLLFIIKRIEADGKKVGKPCQSAPAGGNTAKGILSDAVFAETEN
jgi:hypothetical protein